MASTDTPEYTSQQEQDIKRGARPTMRTLQRSLRLAKYATITLATGAVSGNDTVRLGKLGVKGVVHPEHCRLVGLSGSVEGTFSLQKVPPGGNATALTGLATLATDGVSVPFLRAAGALKEFGPEDELELKIGTATAITAGDTLEFVLAYSYGGTSPAVPPIPENISPPSISGDPWPEEPLAYIPGAWEDADSVVHEWYKNGSPTGSGAATYDDTELGDEIFVRETAQPGNASADSGTTIIVEEPI